MMDRAIKKKWLKALRSGRYRQGDMFLFNGRTNSFCCLGVLGVVQRFPVRQKCADRCTVTLPDENLHGGLTKSDRNILANMNDGTNGPQRSFKEIADYIERHY